MRPILSLLIFLTLLSPLAAADAVKLDKGNTIIFYGNAFAELLKKEGSFETGVHARFPDKQLRLRCHAWPGDEGSHRLRPHNYENNLRDLIKTWPADVVIVCVGMNESFEGAAGIDRFQTSLKSYIHELKIRHPKAQFVFTVLNIDLNQIIVLHDGYELFYCLKIALCLRHCISFLCTQSCLFVLPACLQFIF